RGLVEPGVVVHDQCRERPASVGWLAIDARRVVVDGRVAPGGLRRPGRGIGRLDRDAVQPAGEGEELLRGHEIRRAIAGSGGPRDPGWKIAASASTPSTSRGPGRANDALASTAQTGTPAGSVSRLTRSAARSAAASRWYPQGATTTTSGFAPDTA